MGLHDEVLFDWALDTTGETVEADRMADQEAQDIVDWVTANRRIDGGQWSFTSSGPKIEYGDYDKPSDNLPRPYLFQFLRDKSPEKSGKKPRQSELTENGINENLYYCLTRKYTRVTHVFPTGELGDEISNEKIGPAINGSPRIKHQLRISAVRNYRFRNGSTYSVTGALSRVGGRAGSRDRVLYDEYDFINPGIEGIYNQLLSHSSLRLIERISTATVPGVGIDRVVSASSDNHWFFNCPKCKRGRHQEFEWPGNVINFFDRGLMSMTEEAYVKKLKKTYWGCRYCGTYIDRNSAYYVENGIWVPAHPALEGVNAGYNITAAMIPWKNAIEIVRSFHVLSSYVAQFHNEVWGGAFVKGEHVLSEQDVVQCQRPFTILSARIASLRNVSVGIDQGENISWVVVTAGGFFGHEPEKRTVVSIIMIDDEFLKRNNLMDHKTAHAEAEVRICHAFSPQIIIVDANGIGSDRFKYILKSFPQQHRVWGAFFDTAESRRQLTQSKHLVPQWNEKKRTVTFSKVNAVIELQREFKQQQILIPSPVGEQAEIVRAFVAHQQALAIQPRFDIESQREYLRAVKMSEDDHLEDSHMYARLGYERLVGYGRKSPGVILGRR